MAKAKVKTMKSKKTGNKVVAGEVKNKGKKTSFMGFKKGKKPSEKAMAYMKKVGVNNK